MDRRAFWMLEAYLNSYSFNGFGRARALEGARRQARAGHGVEVPWPEDQLRALGQDTERTPIGIPQGGALSCFLANAVLDAADDAVESAVPSRRTTVEALYLRYVDDIICLATSAPTCAAMVTAYTQALTQLKLPFHDVREFRRAYEGNRESAKKVDGFWAGKSKAPYAWGPAGQPGQVPWCAFVGYHIRYDGVLRVRPSSIKKEVEKQNDVVRQVRHFLRRHGQSRSKRQIIFRLRQRLRSIAVGTGPLVRVPEAAFCWTQGFRLLKRHPSLRGQLRDLDRHRVACVRSVSRALRRKGKVQAKKREDVLRFEGFPYSYAALTEQRGRQGS